MVFRARHQHWLSQIAILYYILRGSNFFPHFICSTNFRCLNDNDTEEAAATAAVVVIVAAGRLLRLLTILKAFGQVFEKIHSSILLFSFPYFKT